LTCISSATYCLTCNTLTHYRTINLTTHTCPCINGYYETSLYTPLICLACHATCLTCSLTSTNCITCDTVNQNRIFSISNNSCICYNGFYETSINFICLTCNPVCITCKNSSTNCSSCDSLNHYRTLNTTTNSCSCMPGYYQTSLNTPTTCLICSPNCLTCASSANSCRSCNIAANRYLHTTTNTCRCLNGFY
jgi:hypothetical protein